MVHLADMVVVATDLVAKAAAGEEAKEEAPAPAANSESDPKRKKVLSPDEYNSSGIFKPKLENLGCPG